MLTPAVLTQDTHHSKSVFPDSYSFTTDRRQTAVWQFSCVWQWLTMLWMCCRVGAWGCGSPLWDCVWVGSGWEPWAGPEPGPHSPPVWTCATDSSLSSASVLPDPIFPGRPDTARSLWLNSRGSLAPAAPWRRSRRSTRQPGLYSYCERQTEY